MNFVNIVSGMVIVIFLLFLVLAVIRLVGILQKMPQFYFDFTCKSMQWLQF